MDDAADARDMPPPTLPTSAAYPQDSVHGQGAQSQASYDRPEPPGRTVQTALTKKAGFKPIGPPSSSLKRFFPGDDDEEDEPEIKTQRQPLPVTVDSPSSKPKPSPVSAQHSEPAYSREGPVRMEQNGHSYAPQQAEVHHIQPIQQFSQPPSPMLISPIPDSIPRHSDVRGSDRRDNYREQDRRTQGPPRSKPGSGYADEPFGDASIHSIHPAEATMPPTPDQGNEEFYRIVSQVGEGTFGKVYKARNSSTGQFVALKRIRMEAERDGFPVTAMREIKLLQSLRHENVVRLYEMMVSNGQFHSS